MNLIAHRGYWNNSIPKNSLESFEKAFLYKVGIETDLRDLDQEIYISHDKPDKECIKFEFFISLYANSNSNKVLALNIKSDGIIMDVKNILDKYHITNYFIFDMSIPELVKTSELDINFFTRMSEFENLPLFLEKSKGVWLDSFNSQWYNEEVINSILLKEKEVVIVSPELHKRDYINTWKFIKNYKLHLNDDVYLCTDLIDLASEYFNE